MITCSDKATLKYIINDYCLPPDGHPLVGGDCVFVEKQTKLMMNFS